MMDLMNSEQKLHAKNYMEQPMFLSLSEINVNLKIFGLITLYVKDTKIELLTVIIINGEYMIVDHKNAYN